VRIGARPAREVRQRERVLVDVLSVGELERNRTGGVYWRSTEAGREELARLRGL
jgi:hypothetical protein